MGEAGRAGREKGNICAYIHICLCLVYSQQTYRVVFVLLDVIFGPVFGFECLDVYCMCAVLF